MCEIRIRWWPMPASARVCELAPSAATSEAGADSVSRPSRVTVTAAKSGWWRSTPVDPRARPHGDVRKTGGPPRAPPPGRRDRSRSRASRGRESRRSGERRRGVPPRARPRSPRPGPRSLGAGGHAGRASRGRVTPGGWINSPARRFVRSSPGSTTRTSSHSRRARRPPTRQRCRLPRPPRRRRDVAIGLRRDAPTRATRSHVASDPPGCEASRDFPPRWRPAVDQVGGHVAQAVASTRARLRKSLAPVYGNRRRIRSSAWKSRRSTRTAPRRRRSRCAARWVKSAISPKIAPGPSTAGSSRRRRAAVEPRARPRHQHVHLGAGSPLRIASWPAVERLEAAEQHDLPRLPARQPGRSGAVRTTAGCIRGSTRSQRVTRRDRVHEDRRQHQLADHRQRASRARRAARTARSGRSCETQHEEAGRQRQGHVDDRAALRPHRVDHRQRWSWCALELAAVASPCGARCRRPRSRWRWWRSSPSPVFSGIPRAP